ncbi:MAG: DUF1592 domain-containing protein [Pseudomonadales bacterium]|nr:DUF1592 domain-containing protein [Pseudomonadales bacterium]
MRFLVITALLMLVACDTGSPEAQGGPVAMRRLTAQQYHNAIADTFDSQILVAGRFEPDSRRLGLNAVGASLVSVTPSGFEQYEAMTRYIVGQVMSPEHRQRLLRCQPQDAAWADDDCSRLMLGQWGRSLFRRPLTEAELQSRVRIASETTTASADFYTGLGLALSSLLVSPDFLFRIEMLEAASTAEQAERLHLSSLSLATRLSYFLWNRGPDEALIAAAQRGNLASIEGLNREIDRMLASEYLAGGVRAFFEDLFTFDQFSELSKDVAHYPLFSNEIAELAREQTLRYVVDHFLIQGRDYPSLFTSRQLPMTAQLGPLYGLPVRSGQDWETLTLPASYPRAGLLSQASFSMLFAHPGRSSPTLRGVFMREALLCQTIPEAPADVDFTLFADDQQTEYKTARKRLTLHATEGSCVKCHQLTDPIGLGLEVFDGIGKFRNTENGAPIDTSGDFDGRSFANPVELGQAFARSPLVGACLVENLYHYAVGREEVNTERRLLRYLEVQFEQSGYRLTELLREIASSEGFRTATQEDNQLTSPSGVIATNSVGKAPTVSMAPTTRRGESL